LFPIKYRVVVSSITIWKSNVQLPFEKCIRIGISSPTGCIFSVYFKISCSEIIAVLLSIEYNTSFFLSIYDRKLKLNWFIIQLSYWSSFVNIITISPSFGLLLAAFYSIHQSGVILRQTDQFILASFQFHWALIQ